MGTLNSHELHAKACHCCLASATGICTGLANRMVYAAMQLRSATETRHRKNLHESGVCLQAWSRDSKTSSAKVKMTPVTMYEMLQKPAKKDLQNVAV